MTEISLSPNRVNGIGGSEAAAVLGLSPWKTPYQVWCDKTGLSGEQEVTPGMEWGNRLEPVIRQKYADQTGRTVRWPVGDEHGHLQSHLYPFMLATLDGIAEDTPPRGLEIKTGRSAREWGEEGTDEVPQAYIIQCQHNMVVADLEVFDVPVLFAGSDFRIYEVPRDRELQALLIEKEGEFWRMVEAKTPPEPITYADAIKRFARSHEETVVATADAIVAVTAYREAVLQNKITDGQIEDAKFGILAALRGADTLVNAEGNVLLTYKRSKDGVTFDEKAFKAAHPDTHKEFLIPRAGSRRLLLKGERE